ncbi:MAG: hypothetical protein A4E32_00764 [Methanomassiliicoccales archaeon PtaU1.Bin124]|nr:MAG: hypothetical protein A4E32_00764 [Methanomassiliicoccales archaeon PtaU1.Bin124]
MEPNDSSGQGQPPAGQPTPYYLPVNKRRPKKKILMIAAVAVVAIVVLAAVLVVFSAPPKGSADNPPHTTVPKTIPTGSFTTVSTGSVSSNGGQITGSLSGLKIEVPTGSVSDTVQFQVSTATVTESQVEGLPTGASIASKMIKIDTIGTTEWNSFKMFDNVLTVTLPYEQSMVQNEERAIRFYQYDEAVHTLEPTGYAGQDVNANTLTFHVSTFSKFVAIEMAMSFFEGLNSSFAVDTGFRPANDGWFIPNYGSYLASGGNCLGMTSFAKWYYTFEKSSSGTGLYSKYRQGSASEWRDDEVAIQLATRSQVGLQGIWASLTEEEKENYSSKATGLSIIHGLLVSGEPQLLGLKTKYNNGTWGPGGHAILVYRYANGRFDTYDPNNPGTSAGTDQQQIPYTFSGGFSRVFKSGLNAANPLLFNVFYHASAKVFSPNNAFKGIYDMAENGFQGNSIFPKVELTDSESDTYGTTPIDSNSDGLRDTSDNKMTISGTITGGQNPVTKTLIFVSGQKFETTIDANGVFSQEVPLYAGDNDVVILATDSNTFTNWAGYLRTTVKSTASPASMTITMSWDQGSSDVDLHVLEPGANGTEGRHIYYSNKGSDSNAPYLDFDNTYGYGPEHYYATESMGLPDPSNPGTYTSLYGKYEIRAHYYRDKDSDSENIQPITFHLHIHYLMFMDEQTGTEYWGDVYYDGYLSSENPYSASNFHSGDASWSGTYSFQYLEPVPSNFGVPNPPQNTFAW